MRKHAIAAACILVCVAGQDGIASEPTLRRHEQAALSTWNRSPLPAYAKPTPAHYIGTCSAGGSCQWDTDCPGGQSCTNGTCGGGSPCYRDVQCASGQTCGNGTCSLSGNTCRLDSQCSTGEKCRKYVDISFKGENTWFIDYGADGYYTTAYPPPTSRWEYAYSGYGYDDAVPAPADYDGDGFTDLSVKDGNGYWYIDYSSNGFGGWDEVKAGYGNSSAAPVPGYYDDDVRADLAVKDSTGLWAIDYASDGFGTWNVQVSLVYGWNYGDANSIPVPADYDGDGKTDISIKNQTNGTWSIDYSSDGFGRYNTLTGTRTQWNIAVSVDGTATPIPADYNNDGKADLGQKDANGTWMIDLAPTFDGWDQPLYSGYGGTSIAVPADYNHDGRLDLSVVDPATGDWYVDYGATATPAYGGWDSWQGLGQFAMRNNSRTLVDVVHPRILSTTVYDENNHATSTLLVGERYTVDVVLEPGTLTTSCASLDEGAPCPAWFGGVRGSCRLINGQKTCVESASVEANPALLASPSLTIHDGSTFASITTTACYPPSCGDTPFCNSSMHVCQPHRRFAIACSQPGSFVLGYQLRNAAAWKGQRDSHPINPDYGIKVVCTSSYSGLYGWVTDRVPSDQRTSNNQPAFYKRGLPIEKAKIRVLETGATACSDGTGFWRLPDVTGGPYTVQITRAGYSDTIAVNINVPASGFELDTPLEEAFTPLRDTGATYTTYIDYSRNRTILHVIAVSSKTDAAIRLEQACSTMGKCDGPLMVGPRPNAKQCQDPESPSRGAEDCPGSETLADAAARVGALAVMNAVWWDLCTGNALGYMYNGSQMPAFPYCYGGIPRPPDTSTNNCTGGPVYKAEGPPWTRPDLLTANKQPMLTVVGQSRQHFGIVETDSNFLETKGPWKQTSASTAIWDPNHDGISDVSYALQMANPLLLLNNAVIAYGNFNQTVPGDYDYVFPRTAVGVKSSLFGGSVLYLVIADGEGIQGGHGATANQMGHFFKDVIGAQDAFALDSGLSTEMVIQGTRQTTPRRVNTLTGEDATIQVVPGLQFLEEKFAGFGAVANFIKVVHQPPVIGERR